MDKLLLPALRAHMGDWIYYLTFMTMKNIAERVSIAEEIHQSKALNELIQRTLEASTRVKQIEEYLSNQAQRFFNAIVVGIYGGKPQWYELSLRSNERFDTDEVPIHLYGALGFLELNGSEKIFAIDGQHRVAGIREAIKEANHEDPLIKEEVATIFVAHSNTDEGTKRTRRLFTTLNRYAKPVSKRDIIALDEDDLVAIVTRRLVEEYPLFKEKISTDKTKNVPPKDQTNFTSIIALYDGLDVYLRGRRTPQSWKNLKRFRLSDDELNSWYDTSVTLWNTLRLKFDNLDEMANSNPEEKVAYKYRNPKGGDLWFRPIGLLLYLRLITILTNHGVVLDESVHDINLLPHHLTDFPWNGLLWDDINKRMLTAPQNQKVAYQLAAYALDIHIPETNRPNFVQDLRKEIAGIRRIEIDEVDLPKFIER